MTIKQINNDDLIRRSTLKEIWELYKKYQPSLATNVYEFGVALKDIIDNATTIETPKGEYIEQKAYPFCYECSICTRKPNFCANCGIRMNFGVQIGDKDK